MPLQKISFEYDIPDGYRFVRFGARKIGDLYISFQNEVRKCSVELEKGCDYDWIIVEKIPEQEQSIAEKARKIFAESLNTPNPNRRKHADLIHAWAEGAEIQWLDGDNFKDIEEPNFYDDDVYRIKPKTKTVRFRNYLTLDGLIGSRYTDVQPGDFVKWLGDWQEVEIEE